MSVQGTAGANIFNVASSTGQSLLTVDNTGQCVTGDTLLSVVPSSVIADLIRNPETCSEGATLDCGSEPAMTNKRDGQIKKVRIDKIKGGEYVMSLDETTGQLAPARIKGLLDMGVKPIYKITTEDGRTIRTTENHPYYVKYEDQKTLLKNSAESLERGGEQGSRTPSAVKPTNWLSDSGASAGALLSSDRRNENYNIKNSSEQNKNISVFGEDVFRGLLTDEVPPSDNQYSQYSIAENFVKSGQWIKVKYLKVGQKIAVASPLPSSPAPSVVGEGNLGSAVWDKIISIEHLPEEQVYDIEVEGTHNFVGNGIIAHNTYISGNLGIGTTSPSQALSVLGKVYTTGGIQFSDGSLQTAAAAAAAVGTAGQVGFYAVNGSTISGTSTLFIASDQNVGLGTTTPTFGKLDIDGNLAIENQNALRLYELRANGVNYAGLTATSSMAGDITWTLPNADGASGRILATNGSGNLYWATAGGGLTGTTGQLAYFSGTDTAVGTSTMFISTAGNVGIGTTSPGTLLSLGNTGANTINISATATSTFGSGLISEDVASTTWAGATSITTLGTITAGTWNSATPIGAAYGGTGLGAGGLAATYIPFGNGANALATSSALYFTTGTSNLTVTNASTTLLSVGAINGPLTANGGFVAATTSIGVMYGGTGSTTLSGILKGNGANMMATAVAGTDYLATLTGNSLTKGYLIVGNDAGLSQATSTVFVSSNGNLGIGTTSPLSKLSVQGTAGANIFNVASSTGQSLLTVDNTGQCVTGDTLLSVIVPSVIPALEPQSRVDRAGQVSGLRA